jgi:hypothetical protein
MLERFGGIGASSLLACPAGAIVVRRGPLPCKFLRVDFLVEIEVALPADLDEDRRSALVAAELERGSALARAGVLRAIWRVPGRLANRAMPPRCMKRSSACRCGPTWTWPSRRSRGIRSGPRAAVCPLRSAPTPRPAERSVGRRDRAI